MPLFLPNPGARSSGGRLRLPIGLLLFALAYTSASAETLLGNSLATVTRAEYDADLVRLPEEYRSAFGMERKRVEHQLQALLMTKSLAAQARAEKLDADPKVQGIIALSVDRILAQLKLEAMEKDFNEQFAREQDKYLIAARERYLVDPKKFDLGEQVRVAHILIGSQSRGDEEARKLAEKLHAELVGGADFADLANKYSEDPGNQKKQGGDLGLMSPAGWVPPFAEAVKRLNKSGDLSPPVKTQYGYHLIRFNERQASRRLSFDEAKASLLDEIRQQKLKDARHAHLKAIEALPKELNQEAIDKLFVPVPKELLKQSK